MDPMTDTIAAIATPPVPAAIGILRLSGPQAAQIAERCFKPLGPKGLLERPSKTLVYGDLLDSGGVAIENNKFLMPDSNVEVNAVFEKDAPPAPTDPGKPSISVTGAYTYNGSEHTATVSGYNPATMDIAGNTATDAGDYTVRVTSKTGRWADGSTGAVTAAWSIGKATQEAPNGLIGVAPTTEGGSDGKITGVTCAV